MRIHTRTYLPITNTFPSQCSSLPSGKHPVSCGIFKRQPREEPPVEDGLAVAVHPPVEEVDVVMQLLFQQELVWTERARVGGDPRRLLVEVLQPLVGWAHGRYPNALLVLRMGVWEVGRVEIQLGKETMHVDRGKPHNYFRGNIQLDTKVRWRPITPVPTPREANLPGALLPCHEVDSTSR